MNIHPIHKTKTINNQQCHYTNLNDKNDVEIYSGDVIELDPQIADSIGARRLNCLVGFKDGAYLIDTKGLGETFSVFLGLVNKSSKVLGSSIENPKLLNLVDKKSSKVIKGGDSNE